MITWFSQLGHVSQALIAGLFTWSITAAGAAVVFLFPTMRRSILDAMLGFAAGVMIAASYWSLLAPAIDMAASRGGSPWFAPLAGFLSGAGFLFAGDKLVPHLHINLRRELTEGPATNWDRTILLVLAITLHNIPEGLAVGVAFGALGHGLPDATLAGAVALAVGIGLQNFPEGVAISMPLRREGISRFKCFWFGQLSAAVEPVAAVIGAAAVTRAEPLLPFALSFAAGAMIFVVVEEVIPESHGGGNTDVATLGTIAGFAVMMVLDVALS
jgi:ZIP family zinc transporter